MYIYFEIFSDIVYEVSDIVYEVCILLKFRYTYA